VASTQIASPKRNTETFLVFVPWKDIDFGLRLRKLMRQPNEATFSRSPKLESNVGYYQGWNRWMTTSTISELDQEAPGYSDGLVYCHEVLGKGWTVTSRTAIAEMVARPDREDDDPDGWYAAARVLDAKPSCESGLPRHTAHRGTYSESPNTISDARNSASDHLRTQVSHQMSQSTPSTCAGI